MTRSPIALRALVRPLVCCLAVTVFALPPAGRAHAALPTKEMLQRLPPSVNAISVIDVEALLNSPLAKKQKWHSKRDVEYGTRPLMVPPEAKTVLVGALLDPSNDLGQQWQVSLIDMATDISIDDIAKTEGGYVDPIDDVAAAWTPSDAYALEIAPHVLAMAQPANRQAISRWLKFAATNKEPALSEYLTNAMSRLTDSSQFVLALDLADVPKRHKVEERLAELDMFSGRDMKRAEVADLLVGLQGITATVSVTDSIQAELRVDFRDDVGPLGDLAKPLVLAALDAFDAHLSDIDGFEAQLNGKSVTLSGPLSIDGLRRVGSLLQMSTTKFSDLQDVDPAESGSSNVVQASLQYYNSITALIEDLRHTLEDSRDNHAVWMERYGRKVDALPILNVDSDLLAWGANVAVTFREMGLAKRGAGIRGGVRKSAVYGDYSYSDGGYYASYRPAADVKNQINREEQAQAKAVRYNSWKEIEDTRADIRRQMTLKYSVEF
ncbi:MAG: hypothetical protein JNG89_02420 [Planctomycetaceae bacterium]|nr:hypothetical protein [Planctomycetaceae bacterium]